MKYRMTNRGKAFIAVFVFIIIIPICLIFTNSKPESVSVQNTSVNTTSETSVSTTSITSAVPSFVSSTKDVTVIPERISGCSSALVYSLENDKILFSQDIGRMTAPASLTKLLTACTALEYLQPQTICTAGSELFLVQPDSSLCYINQGQQISAEHLITGMIMASGNDAAYTLAVNTVRNYYPDIYMTDNQAVECFCGFMNDFASEIGMNSSNFVNPDGWDNTDQYTTAYDLCLLARYALTVPEIRNAASCYEKQITINSGEVFTWHNSNKFLDPYSEFYNENVTGLKTGTTLNAGNCLISVFEKNGMTFLCAVTGCATDYERYNLTLRLINEYT